MHIPFQDKVANKLVFNFIKDFKPDYIDILGDLIDFWEISKFKKDPSRVLNIQKDIDQASIYLEQLRDISPKSVITLHYGNHLTRFKKYIWEYAKELVGLRSLNLSYMLRLDELSIKSIEEEEGYDRRGNLCLTHGTVVSQDSGATARRMLKKFGISVIHGHTHRLGSTFKTDLRGMVGAWENGCLCDLKLVKQWGKELADWQQGFSVIHSKDHRFLIQQIPIIKGTLLFGEKEYRNE